MTARKAANGKRKTGAKGKDPTLKISTFRLREEHRQAVDSYALALGQSMKPPKVVSKTEAIQHMIMHARPPEQMA